MDEAEIRNVIENSPFAGQVDELMRQAAPMLRLVRSDAPRDDLPPGASRIGGLPGLPPGTAWPVNDGRPLDLIAQIDLSDAAAAARLPDLPTAGWLAFFYDVQEQPWGFDPRDEGGWRVVYFDGEAASLRRMTPPDPVAPARPRPPRGLLGRIRAAVWPATREPAAIQPFPAHAVRFVPAANLPTLFDLLDVDVKDKARWRALEEIDEKLNGEGRGPDHWLGGNPLQIQADMKLECQLASNGLYCGDGDAYESERGRALAAGADDWRLLLQIDTDEEGPGWMWGDVGMIYFWIRRQDLAARAFDKVWCVLQCA